VYINKVQLKVKTQLVFWYSNLFLLKGWKLI